MNRILTAFLFLFICTGVEARQLIQNGSFHENLDGWQLWWGNNLDRTADDGHFSSGGAAVVSGHTEGWAAVRTECIDVSNTATNAIYKIGYSFKPSGQAADPATSVLIVGFHSDTECNTNLSNPQISTDGTPGFWNRVDKEFTHLGGAHSISLIFGVIGTPDGALTRFDDISLSVTRSSQELLQNSTFTDGTDPWVPWWSDSLNHDTANGAFTAGGAGMTLGNIDGDSGIRSECLDISDRHPMDQYHLGISIAAGELAQTGATAIYIDYFAEADCTDQIGNSYWEQEATSLVWNRHEEDFSPPSDAKSMVLVPNARGLANGAGGWFDDASVVLTRAMRHMWLIGVGSVSGRSFTDVDMAFTRGGEFGNVVPEEITRQGFITLEMTFINCNEAIVTWVGGDAWAGFGGSYTVYRLATNQSVLFCEEVGFENMGDNNDFMTGYWSSPAHDGEGFGIDTLKGGDTVVITFYTYLPRWGRDAD